jgi:hypothetical protein
VERISCTHFAVFTTTFPTCQDGFSLLPNGTANSCCQSSLALTSSPPSPAMSRATAARKSVMLTLCGSGFCTLTSRCAFTALAGSPNSLHSSAHSFR